MIISDENSYPIMVDSVETPLSTEFFWVLDLVNRDFKLTPLTMNEELHTPTFELSILGYVIEVPTNWNVLLYSEETSQLDIAEVSELTRGNFTALGYQHKKDRVAPGEVKVINYNPYAKVYTPSLHKTHMLCHALGPELWVCISPSDNYNKYLKNAMIGDILP
jgi:hypothetical protein